MLCHCFGFPWPLAQQCAAGLAGCFMPCQGLLSQHSWPAVTSLQSTQLRLLQLEAGKQESSKCVFSSLRLSQSASWGSWWWGVVIISCLEQSEGSEQDLRASLGPFAEHQSAGKLRLSAVCLRRGPGSPQRRRPVPGPG